jgi:hypothetical protein
LKATTLDSDERAKQLQLHLHELAEGLQAARYFLEILQNPAAQRIDATLIEKTTAQLHRAEEGFRHLRDRLGKLTDTHE